MQTPHSDHDSHGLRQLLGERLFITDGGLETTLIFDRGLDLPCFAAFPLVADEPGRALLRDYFAPYLATATTHRAGFVLDTPTWRASPDWGARLGFDSAALAEVNRASVELAVQVRGGAGGAVPIVINGVLGPRGDGYSTAEAMSAADAQRYHAFQVEAFAETRVDILTAVTLTYAEEAVGVVRAASAAGVPVAISFTVETDGRLPSGQHLHEAIEQVDEETGQAAIYFMINCAHPTHFASALAEDAGRIRGVRANASRKSHAELDESEDLDRGDPDELAAHYRELHATTPSINVLGGCCGTDHRHIAAICAAVAS